MARLIDKDKALFDAFHLGKIEDMFMVSAQDVCDMIRKQEEIDAVPVDHGHWGDETLIKANYLFRNGYHAVQLKCSKCKRYASELTDYVDSMPQIFRYKFCPWCGVKMDEEEGE